MKKLRSAQHDELFSGILELQTVEECYAFFEDICTVNELKALSQRLQVAKMLRAGDSYETIVEETGASTATISRVKRCLVYGADGYTLVLDRLAETKRFIECFHKITIIGAVTECGFTDILVAVPLKYKKYQEI